jgi:uncharacterized membrane protein YphA (DoxX/SURF4 family)
MQKVVQEDGVLAGGGAHTQGAQKHGRDADNRPDRLARAEEAVLRRLRRLSVPALRIALGVIFIWFGGLKIAGATPVADLVTAVVPFLPADFVVLALGVFEVVAGLALVIGYGLPWVAALLVGHLAGTFLVFFVRPDLTYDGNPLLLTMEGEFAAKNMVLITAALVVAAFSTRPEPELRT